MGGGCAGGAKAARAAPAGRSLCVACNCVRASGAEAVAGKAVTDRAGPAEHWALTSHATWLGGWCFTEAVKPCPLSLLAREAHGPQAVAGGRAPGGAPCPTPFPSLPLPIALPVHANDAVFSLSTPFSRARAAAGALGGGVAALRPPRDSARSLGCSLLAPHKRPPARVREAVCMWAARSQEAGTDPAPAAFDLFDWGASSVRWTGVCGSPAPRHQTPPGPPNAANPGHKHLRKLASFHDMAAGGVRGSGTREPAARR